MIDLFKKQSNRRGYAYIWTLRPKTKNKEQVAAPVISNLWDTKNLTYSNDTTQISLMLVEFAHKDKKHSRNTASSLQRNITVHVVRHRKHNAQIHNLSKSKLSIADVGTQQNNRGAENHVTTQ